MLSAMDPWKSNASWVTTANFARQARPDTVLKSVSSTHNVPLSGLANLLSMCAAVVLPDPESPTKATT